MASASGRLRVAMAVQIVLLLGCDTRPAQPAEPVRGTAGIVADGTWLRQSDLAWVGEYYGLVIGIDRYGPAEWQLRCAVSDAKAVAKVLREDYGFREIAEVYNGDATRVRIEAEMAKLDEKVTPNDSVLIYYAGHGTLEKGTGYWIPVDGKPRKRWTYLRHIAIRDMIKTEQLKARHVLLVTDSCYAGALFRSAKLPEKTTPAYVRAALGKTARQCITSGGLYPVPDGTPGGHSVFAKTFLRILDNPPRDAFVPSDIMRKLKEDVSLNAPEWGGQPQVPILGVFKQAGGEADGEFVFLRRRGPAAVAEPAAPDVAKWERDQRELKRLRAEADLRRREQELLAAAKQAFAVAKQYDEADFVDAKRKAEKWAAYVAQFRSTGHQVSFAHERLEHWRTHREPVAPPSTAVPSGRTWTNPTDGSEMILVPAGTFKMGEDSDAHDVRVDAFYIGKCEVTNRQFSKFLQANPQWRKDGIDSKYHDGKYLKHWDGDTCPSDKADHPVVYVSWSAAKAYCEWAGGHLPTEAEWEYACRAGSTTKYCFGDSDSEVVEYAWYDQNSGKSSHPVGQKKPNKWGIHDMHGNVWEWCSSKYEPYPYKAEDGREDLNDPGSRRVVRGGGWGISAIYCRSASRGYFFTPANCRSSSGFRVCASSRAPK